MMTFNPLWKHAWARSYLNTTKGFVFNMLKTPYATLPKIRIPTPEGRYPTHQKRRAAMPS